MVPLFISLDLSIGRSSVFPFLLFLGRLCLRTKVGLRLVDRGQRVGVAVLAFGFSDFAPDFFDFFVTSSSDALLCALSPASSSSSLGARRFGIGVKIGGAVDQIRGNIARRRRGSPDLALPFTTHGDHQSTPIASVSGRHTPLQRIGPSFSTRRWKNEDPAQIQEGSATRKILDFSAQTKDLTREIAATGRRTNRKVSGNSQ